MYIRFVVNDRDPDSGRRQGLFQKLWELRDTGVLSWHDIDSHRLLNRWFGEHLEAPASLARSSRPHAKEVAISWYKDSSNEHIARMYEMAGILDRYGVQTEVLTTERPGYVVYEDENQIVAEPYADTTT